MEQKRPKILRVILLLAVLGGGGYYAWTYFNRAAVAAGPLTASGTVEARQVTIASEISGRVVMVGPEQGQTVKAGDVLAKLDDLTVQAQLEQARAAVQTAQSNYDLLAAGPTAEQVRQLQAVVAGATANLSRTVASARPADVAAAQSALYAAGQAYQKLKDGPAVNDLAAANAQLQNAEAALRQAQGAYDAANRRNPAAIGSSPAALALEQATNAYNLAKANYDRQAQGADAAQLAAASAQIVSARAALDRAKAPSRDFDVIQAQAQLDQAKAQLDALKVGTRPEQLAVAKAQLASAQAQLKTIEVQLARYTVTAPSDGVVLARSIESGEITAPGTALYEIGKIDRLEVTVYLPEEEIGLVAANQPVTLKVDAYPTRTFNAVVSKVADQAEFTPRNVQTVSGRKDTVFAVLLNIDNTDLALKPGMPADATFPRTK